MLCLVASVLVVAGTFVLAGCGQDRDVVTPTQAGLQQSVDLNDVNGGFKPTDEKPAFGDAGLLEMAREEFNADDLPGSNEPSLFAESNPGPRRIYTVSVIWGMLPGNANGASVDLADPPGKASEDGDTYDWSGGMDVSRGGIHLRSVVSFEDGDRVVWPRRERGSIEWISHTGPGWDGIRFVIYQPPFEEGGVEEDTLYFRAGEYTRTFLLSELDELNETVAVGVEGNSIRFQARMIDPTVSNHGFARGRWTAPAEGDTVGLFGGILVSDYGRVAGYFHGHYGQDDQGKAVLFAKVTGANGEFRGFLRGSWGQASGPGIGSENGWFQARWFDGAEENEQEIGAVRGAWQRAGRGPGQLWGRWCLGCSLDGGTDI